MSDPWIKKAEKPLAREFIQDFQTILQGHVIDEIEMMHLEWSDAEYNVFVERLLTGINIELTQTVEEFPDLFK